RVGDGATVDQGELLTAGQGAQAVVHAIPADARLQRGELLHGWHAPGGTVAVGKAGELVATRHHLQDGIEGRRGELAVRVGAAHEIVEGADVPVLDRDHRH